MSHCCIIYNDCLIKRLSLVCGGHDMAAGVKQVVNDIVLPLGIDVDQLILKVRYLEDVY